MGDINDDLKSKLKSSTSSTQQNTEKEASTLLKLSSATLINQEKQLKVLKEQLAALTQQRKVSEDIEDVSNDSIIKAKQEYNLMNGKLKILQGSLKIEKIKSAIDKISLDTIDTQRKIQIRINELKKLGLDIDENSVSSKEDLLKVSNKALTVEKKQISILKEQTKEIRSQLKETTKKMGISDALKSDLVRAGSAIKDFAHSNLGQLFSAATFASGFKDARNMLDSVYDSYWRLSLPVEKMDSSTTALGIATFNYEKTLLKVKDTASKWGFDIDKVADSMAALENRVRFVNTTVKKGEKKYDRDIEGLGKVTESLIAFSRTMRMDIDEGISLYEERIRKFGDTNEEAIGSISDLAKATISFNDLLGNGAVFADEIGKHLLEVQQSTRYWTQDMGMLNTMMNSHVNLLISQGKSQKQALEITKAFGRAVQEPPDLIKWNAGKKLLQEYKSLVKGLSEEEAVQKIVDTYGVTVGQARSLHQEVQKGGNTGYSNALLMQEVLGGTKKGTSATINAYSSMMDKGIKDISVLKDSFNLGDNLEMASNLKQLFMSIKKDKTLGPEATMEEAMRGAGKRMGFDEAQIQSMVETLNKGGIIDEKGETKESKFQNVVVNTLNKLEKWLEDPFVKLLAGSVGMGGKLLANSATVASIIGSITTVLGRGGIRKGGKFLGGKLTSVGKVLTKRRSFAGTGAKMLSGIKEVASKKIALPKGLPKGFPKGFPKGKAGLAMLAVGALGSAVLGDKASKAIGKSRGGQLALGTAETALAFAGPVGAGITAIAGAFEGALNGAEGKKIKSTFAGAIAGFLGPIGKISESLGLAGEGAAEAVGDFRNLVGVMDGIFGSYDPQERAGMTAEGEARLKAQGYETDLDKVKKADRFGRKTKEEYLEGKGMYSAEGIKQYQKMESIAKANLQSKFGGDVSDADVQAETQRIMEEQFLLEKENLKTQETQLKAQEDLLKITKASVNFDKLNTVDSAIDRIASGSGSASEKESRLNMLGISTSRDTSGRVVASFSGLNRVIAAEAR